MSDVPSHTPQRARVFALQTDVRKKALWGHTRPALKPLFPGQPNLFWLPRTRLQVPFVFGEGDTQGHVELKRETTEPGPLLTHIHLPATAPPQASPAPLVSPNPSFSAPAPAQRPRSTPPPPAHQPLQPSPHLPPPPARLYPARSPSSASLPPNISPTPPYPGSPPSPA